MGGAPLLRLKDELHGVRRQGVADSLRLVADHHQRPLHAQAPAQVQNVSHHRQAAQRVKHLHQIGAHPRSLAGGHHHGA